MATVDRTPKACSKCNKGFPTTTCDGCQQSFCSKHIGEHRQELSLQMDSIWKQYDVLKGDIEEQGVNKVLFAEIERWEKESIEKIRSSANKARADLERLTAESKSRLRVLMSNLSKERRQNPKADSFTEKSISQWKMQLENLRKDVNALSGTSLIQKDDSSSLRLIMIKNQDTTEDNTTHLPSENTGGVQRKPNEVAVPEKLPHNGNGASNKSESSTKTNPPPSQTSSYPNCTFGITQSSHKDIKHLLEKLMLLDPMDKNGPMSGKCDPQTSQMEKFLTQNFGFKNTPGKYIVQGVKSFQLDRYPHSMDPNTVIHFPSNTKTSFAMTVKEIVTWQRSYKVYAGKRMKGMDKVFLTRAVQGQSGDDVEAFYMKFVVRISTSPILMEFDANIIPRKLEDEWPHRIKLVSVTGIDFAGRKHDVGDILHYVSNWRDIFVVDREKDEPALLNERDFCLKKDRRKGELEEDRLLADLIYMARLRLQACDAEGVQIVVETGIGLGVFSGKHIGIDGKVRLTSALAIRTVLEEDGPKYRNIRAIVFALPILDENDDNGRIRHCFSDFVEQFQEPQYNGPIPVLIADQDMHRLTVAIARHGFFVSQLNPADSHGVFGEYWQNRGPAVEEKLALTTLGLLVQHHLINPRVLDPDNYYLI